VEGDKLMVKAQEPKAPALEVWDDYGSPVERVGSADPRWQFQGAWKIESKKQRGGPGDDHTRYTSEKGAEAAITFEGTGAIVTGPYLSNGGKLDAYLDGQAQGTRDVYSDETESKTGESVWHAFGLKSGKHTVRLVVRGEPGPGSPGSAVGIEDVVVFR
jgi:hypothetical protein